MRIVPQVRKLCEISLQPHALCIFVAIHPKNDESIIILFSTSLCLKNNSNLTRRNVLCKLK